MSWVLATVVSVAFAMTAAGAVNAETGRDSHNRTGSKLLRDIAQTAAVDAAVELLKAFIPQMPERDTNVAADFFKIPKQEYERWPEGRRRVVRAIYAIRESFRKRTIALVKTLDTEDWELMERVASYIVVPSALLPTSGFEGTLSFDELGVWDEVELQAMGIIGSPSVLGTQTTFAPRPKEKLYQAIRFGDHVLVIRFKDAEHVVDWPVTPITKVGQELLPLLQSAPNLVTPEWNYMRALGEGLAKEGVAVELWEVSEGPNAEAVKREKQIWAIPATK